MKLKKIFIAAAVSAALGGMSAVAAPAKTDLYNSDNWQGKFPEQHKTWASTEDNNPASGVPQDYLLHNPNLVIAWAGYGFAKDYNRARGHHFALNDVIQSLRTGGPMGDMDGPMAASCWSCKSPDVARMYDEVGEGKFANNKFGKWGHEMANTIGCADCHELGESELRLSRPYAARAMEAIDRPFDKQSHAEQGNQACGQCHVEYYFDGTDDKKVKFPWDQWKPGVETQYIGKGGAKTELYKGYAAEAGLAYYDMIGFSDWTNAISGAPMLKTQHPEYENLADRRNHEMAGDDDYDHEKFTCTTCHTPKQTNSKGQEYTDHNVRFDFAKLPEDCAGCHEASDMEEILSDRKAEINKLRFDAKDGVDVRLTQIHFWTQAIWKSKGVEGLESGKNIAEAKANYEAALKKDADMVELTTHIRNAQWFWDSATASHGIHAHNPEEAKRLLNKAKGELKLAEAKAASLLKKPADLPVYKMDDLASKQAAQKAAGLNYGAMVKEKTKFIEERANKQWPHKLQEKTIHNQ
ncbi:ammonia-forming cytochrome c nitrite reductase subunit c552 [Paraferrimonas sedimenticola]|uniref:nitrite reductase (cytochrome; ammonia-forming) n=1 Tax=Paraferrimonas sedimenticola TaxID=375674 RepID=A0AA37W076_9GAMM|nr:ammonia-forming cytochrome c nitrite reductase subunit c552 [Paraferrimonas sedimenticola]GLP95098.1 cytochrome c-552 [Paraferrimonas sedimenticola]